MLTKIIDLGFETPETGEPRVRLIQPGLVKTASTEIQRFWDSMPPDPASSFLWVIGVSAREYYGCNNNGDAFDEADLKKTHNGFVDSAHVFIQHVNKDPAKSIGKPVFSWYNDVMRRVELILRIDKDAAGASAIVAKIQAGEPIFVSMGCKVDFDVCSICENHAQTRKDYCDHLRYNMKKILPDGRQVYALNPNPKFFDISIVARPADPTAFTLDKRASLNKTASACFFENISSSELGEASEDMAMKTAALKKLSDMVKRVEGQVVDAKDVDALPEFDALDKIRAAGFEHLDYPVMPYDRLTDLGVSPAGLLSCLSSLGAPMTLGDAAWMCGLGSYGHAPNHNEYHNIFNMFPRVLPYLSSMPETIDGVLRRVFGAYNGELEEPLQVRVIMTEIIPAARARVRIISSLAHPDELVKIGTVFGTEDKEIQFGNDTKQRLLNTIRSRKENFAPIILKDRYGQEAKTSPYFLRQAMFQSDSANGILVKPALLTALAMGSLGAVMIQPTLLKKALALTAVGLPCAVVANLLKGPQYKSGIITSEGGRLPDHIAEATFKFEKKAMKGPGFATVAGMAIPAALGLDYAWNRWRYGPYENPEDKSLALKAGKFVMDNPAASVFGGGVAGAALGRLLRLKR